MKRKDLANNDVKVGFIGFGNMARALAEGFVRSGALGAAEIGACARDWDKLCTYAEPRGFRPFRDAESLTEFADWLVVAVKPHQVEAVLAPLGQRLAGKVIISVAAGYTFDRYESMLPAGIHHISTIPNTPVAVCEGIVVCERRHSLSAEEYRTFDALFSHVGLVLAQDTRQLGIAGTVCGCGPAFAALFIEALSDAAVKYGIRREEAYRLVSQMIVGTGKLQLETGIHPGAMKDAVCSPGGTTIVGVTELDKRGFRGALVDAVDAIERKDIE